MNHTKEIFDHITGKVLFIEPFSSHILVSGLDLAVQLKAKNCEISFCNISLSLPSSDTNRPISKYLGSTEKYYWSKIKKILINESINIVEPPSIEKIALESCKKFAYEWPKYNLKLSNYRYKGANLGLAVKSSLISIKLNSRININKHKKLIQKKLLSSAIIYERSLSLIKKIKPDWVIYFNGRSACSYPVEFICNKYAKNHATREIHFSTFAIDEKRKKEIIILSDKKIHDFNTSRNKIYEASKGLKRKNLEKIATDFYDQTTSVRNTFLDSYVKDNYSTLTTGNKKLAVFFHSCDDELAAVSTKQDKLFPTQIYAFREVEKAINKFSNKWKLVLRVHPRMNSVSKKERDLWNNLNMKNGILIPSFNPTHAKRLIDQADLIFAYSTSLIAYCNFIQKKLILLGDNSFFWGLNFGIEPKKRSDLQKLIKNLDSIKTFSNMPSLKYAYWQMIDGIDLKYTIKKESCLEKIPPTYVFKDKYNLSEVTILYKVFVIVTFSTLRYLKNIKSLLFK